MNAISVNNIAKSVKDEYLFSNVTFGLDVGEHIGIIGKNGAGKSTFLKLLAGSLLPDEGEIVTNKSLRIGYLSQDVSFTEDCTLESYLRQSDDLHVQLLNRYYNGEHDLMEKIESLGLWGLEDRYRRYLSELGVTEPMDKKMSQISGGTQKKAAIARILAIEPNILLLDEPTNHLDIPSIEWLEEHLKTSSANTTAQGAFTVVLVTHDRYFLDCICTRIMEIDRNRAYFYEGGYTDFLSKREERISALAKEQDRLANILRRELEWLRRGPKARTGKDSSRKQRIEQMLGQQIHEEDGPRAFGSITRRMGKKILELKNVTVSRGGRTLFKDFDLEFIKGQRIGIIGPNGSGKTSLLEVLTGNLAPDLGIVDTGVNTAFGYYDQQSAKLPLDKTPVEYFSDFAQNIIVSQDYIVTPARFLELFGFPSSFHRLPIGVLSGGEKRRLYLLSCLMTNPNFLVLDEPTNDLDIDTLRRLEQYILDFQGCVVAVSHDRAFLDRICTELIVMPEDERLYATRYEGNYSDWKQDQDELKKSKTEASTDSSRNASYQSVAHGSNSQGSNTQSSNTQGSQVRTQKKGLSYKQQKEFDQLELDIQNLEEEKQALEDFFSSGTPDTTGEKTRRYSILGQELDEKYARWEELASLA